MLVANLKDSSNFLNLVLTPLLLLTWVLILCRSLPMFLAELGLSRPPVHSKSIATGCWPSSNKSSSRFLQRFFWASATSSSTYIFSLSSPASSARRTTRCWRLGSGRCK